MPTLYVISSQYMSLIATEEREKNRKIHSEKITKEKLEATFNDSKPLMLGFKTKDEAMIFSLAALKRNNTTSDFIKGNIPFFAVPVVYTVEYDESAATALGALNGRQVLSYMESKTIPYYDSSIETGQWQDSAIALIDQKIADAIKDSETTDTVSVYRVSKANLQIVEACYLACNPLEEATVKFAQEKEPPAVTPTCILL